MDRDCEGVMTPRSKIIITGHNGLVGSALVKYLEGKGFKNIFGVNSNICDLKNLTKTINLFKSIKPNFVFHLAGSVYGILGNMAKKAESYFDNVLINTNTIEASHQVGVEKIVCMGTGAVYPYPPKSMPLKEKEVWEGKPHSSEDSYAHAKRGMMAQLIAYQESYGMKYSYVISCNLFGPNDRFNIVNGHVVPSLIRKFREAELSNSAVKVWGTGAAKRDFLFSEDAAEALVLIMNKFDGEINLGSGREASIKDIVEILCEVSGYYNVVWDESKPDGQLRRIYDLANLEKIGFRPKHSLRKALDLTYKWFIANEKNYRA